MVRSAAVGFGAATMLAMVGSLILGGQAMLGTRHLAAAQAGSVTAIRDVSVRVPAPMQTVVPARVGGAASPRRAVSAPSSSRGRVQVHVAAPLRAASASLGQSLRIDQLMHLAQSQAMPNVAPTGGTMSGTAFLPGILQQFTNPLAAPAPAPAVQPTQEPSPMAPVQPNLAAPAVNLVNGGGGRDAGDGQR
jgi:hypothetical protein